MTEMTPRDALEVMREFWRRSDLISPTFDEAIAVLNNLVDRAGEPVATPTEVAYVMGYVQGASDYTTDEIKTSELIRNANEAAAADGYPLPPPAPGASHER